MAQSVKEKFIRFVADLKNENPGITWEEVAERVQTEFPNARGVPLTGNATKEIPSLAEKIG